jgi:p-hydroxybenzoate 3-monooxygenase
MTDRSYDVPGLRTQVAIIGAGPAGLALARLLERQGIDSVVLEDRSRDYVEHRIRAGVLERGSVELLEEAGCAERLNKEGLVHTGICLQFAGERHRIDFDELAGASIVVYGQTEVVKDLISARVEPGGPLLFEVSDVALHDLTTSRPRVTFRHGGRNHELECAVVAGCDGSRGVCRGHVAPGVLQSYSRDYPFAWLGILAAVAPSNDELIYAHSNRGFALASMRSPELSRLYLQCRPDEDLATWPDERIWEELQLRLGLPGWELAKGPVLEKGITPMRSLVFEPMQYGRLFLAGDAAHIVPPTGAKGLNLALRDVGLLAEALVDFFIGGTSSSLGSYSERCLRRVWRYEHFSWWMTSMLHLPENANAFEQKLQVAQLRYTTTSSAAARTLAENYVGLAPV